MTTIFRSVALLQHLIRHLSFLSGWEVVQLKEMTLQQT